MTATTTKPMTASVTYDTVTSESAERGDYAESGYEIEPRTIMPADIVEALELHDTVEEAVESLIPYPGGYVGIRGAFDDSGDGESFYSLDSSENYRTGESTRYTIHLDNWPLSLLTVAARILTGR